MVAFAAVSAAVALGTSPRSCSEMSAPVSVFSATSRPCTLELRMSKPRTSLLRMSKVRIWLLRRSALRIVLFWISRESMKPVATP